jgi:hypothetical protein
MRDARICGDLQRVRGWSVLCSCHCDAGQSQSAYTCVPCQSAIHPSHFRTRALCHDTCRARRGSLTDTRLDDLPWMESCDRYRYADDVSHFAAIYLRCHALAIDAMKTGCLSCRRICGYQSRPRSTAGAHFIYYSPARRQPRAARAPREGPRLDRSLGNPPEHPTTRPSPPLVLSGRPCEPLLPIILERGLGFLNRRRMPERCLASGPS